MSGNDQRSAFEVDRIDGAGWTLPDLAIPGAGAADDSPLPEMAIILDTDQKGGAYIDLAGDRIGRQGLVANIVGYRGGGKTYALAYFCEQLAGLDVPYFCLDPSGTMRGLLELPGTKPWQGKFKGIMESFVFDGVSYYTNLSGKGDEVPPMILAAWIKNYLEYVQANEPWTCALVLDDLARFIPGKGATDTEKVAGAAMIRLIEDSRRLGLYILSTVQRLDRTLPEVTTQGNLWLFSSPGSAGDFKKSKNHLPVFAEEALWNAKKLAELKTGEFLMISQARSGKVKVPQRVTTDYGQAPNPLKRPARGMGRGGLA